MKDRKKKFKVLMSAIAAFATTASSVIPLSASVVHADNDIQVTASPDASESPSASPETTADSSESPEVDETPAADATTTETPESSPDATSDPEPSAESSVDQNLSDEDTDTESSDVQNQTADDDSTSDFSDETDRMTYTKEDYKNIPSDHVIVEVIGDGSVTLNLNGKEEVIKGKDSLIFETKDVTVGENDELTLKAESDVHDIKSFGTYDRNGDPHSVNADSNPFEYKVTPENEAVVVIEFGPKADVVVNSGPRRAMRAMLSARSVSYTLADIETLRANASTGPIDPDDYITGMNYVGSWWTDNNDKFAENFKITNIIDGPLAPFAPYIIGQTAHCINKGNPAITVDNDYKQTSVRYAYLVEDQPDGRIKVTIVSDVLRNKAGQPASAKKRVDGVWVDCTYQRMQLEITLELPNKNISISLTKQSADPELTDGNSNYSLANAKFKLYTDAACTQELATLSTDADGNAVLGGITVASDTSVLYLKEVEAPKGFILNSEVIPITVSGTVTNPVIVKEQPEYGNLDILKVDADGNPVAGASFELRNSSGQIVASWVSDGTKKQLNKLPYGNYTIVETAAPSGYVKVNPISVTINSQGTQTFTVKNIRLTAQKTDQVTATGLRNATLAVYDSQNKVVDQWVTDGTPHIIQNLVEDQSYTLKEINTPFGYETADPISFNTTGEANIDLTMQDMPKKVYIRIVKEDWYDNSYKLSGAVFTLHRADGSVETDINGNPCTGTTDSEGKLSFTVYMDQDNPSWYFTEDQAPEGYLNDHEGEKFEVTPDENYTFVESDDTFAYEITDRADTKLFLEKTDKDTAGTGRITQGDGTMAGAKFKIIDGKTGTYLKDDNGEDVIITTGEDGVTNPVLYLPLDRTWYAEEIGAPEGYKMSPGKNRFALTTLPDADGSSDITTTVEEDVMTGVLHLYKHYNAIIGESEFDDVPEEGATFAAVLTSFAEQYGDVNNRETIIKALEHKDQLTNKEYSIKTTDENGMLKFDPLAYGEYTIAQIDKTDPETKIIEETYQFTVGDDWTPTTTENQEEKYISATNDQQDYYLRILKKDAKTGATVTFNSAEFKITMIKDANGNDVNIPVVQYVGGVPHSIFKTTSQTGKDGVPAGTFYVETYQPGETITPLTVLAGTYKIEEVATPDGFTILNDPITLEVNYGSYTEMTENKIPVFTAVAKDTPITGTLELHKEIEDYEADKTFINRDDLSNIGFTLTAAEDIINMDDGSVAVKAGEVAKNIYGQEVGHFFLNKDGTAKLTDLYLGKYVLVETDVPDGMIGDTEPREIVFAQKEGDVQTAEYKISEDYMNKTTKVSISKKEVTGDDELEGAHLAVINSDGEVVDSWTSGKEPHTIEGLNLGEEYTLREDLAPLGYAVATSITFTVNEDGSVTPVEMIDKYVDVDKVDTDGHKLIGAVLSVTDEDGAIVDKWVTDGETVHRINNLVVGKTYVLHEDRTPDGFTKAEDLTFTVEDDKQNQHITLVDTFVEVEKTDSNKDILPGAVMSVTDEDGNVVDTWTTDNTTYRIHNLEVGKTYVLHEDKAPEGYVRAADVTFTVNGEEDQHIVVIDKQVLLTKEDGNGEEVPGANIQIIDEDGNVVDEWTSTDKAHPISNLQVGHEYTWHEDVSEIVGYYYATDYTFEVTDDGMDQELVMIDSPIRYQIAKVDDDGKYVAGVTLKLTDITNPENPVEIELPNEGVTTEEPFELDKVLTAEHTYLLEETEYINGYYLAESMQFVVPKYGTADVTTISMLDLSTAVTVSKVDNHGNPVAGAKLQVIEATVEEDGTITEGDVAYEFVTTDQPTDISDYVMGDKTYILREVETPFGYETAQDQMFTVTGTKENFQLLSMTDTISQIKVHIHKTNEDGSKPLEGAEFTVYNAKTNEVAKTISGTDAIGTTDASGALDFVLEYSADGYYVKETKAPANYEINADKFDITINEGYNFDEPYVIEVHDEEKPKTGLLGVSTPIYIACIAGGIALIGVAIALKIKSDKSEKAE